MSKTKAEVFGHKEAYLKAAIAAEASAAKLEENRAQHQKHANRCADEAHKLRLAAAKMRLLAQP